MVVMGLMSGTSVDGIDVAIAKIEGQPATPERAATLRLQPRFFVTLPWPANLRTQIFTLLNEPTTPAALCQINFDLGEAFAEAALTALQQAQLQPSQIDLIGSHGQTIWHAVQNGQVTSTLQLGEPAIIAARTGITTVGNFRVADIARGGQGAPLVSTFDWHLLRPSPDLLERPDGWRAVQNIGGIANVTFLPNTALTGAHADPLAFDTGPGNALIDWAASEATQGAWQYDVDGRLAAQGVVDEWLLSEWLSHPFFAAPPPKSTGRELFSRPLAQQWRTEALARGRSDADFIATLTALTATSIALAYAKFAPGPVVQTIIGGGGARNPTLMQMLAAALEQQLGRRVPVLPHEAIGFDSDAKEALAFALLAYFTIHGWPNNVPACTGAQAEVILGQITPGQNYANLLQSWRIE